MPTNVAPEYKDAEAKYRAAKTDEEKLAALEEMARTLNKHKGTEKLYADIKSRIKALRGDLEKREKHKGHAITVEREGAAQIALCGAPNAGKSSVLAALTRAAPEIGDYPFTTVLPLSGIMHFEDVGLQLVDLPPLAADHTEGWLYGIVRVCDAVLLVFDITALDPVAEIESVRSLLAEHGIPLLGTGETASEDPRLASKPVILVGTRRDVPGAEDMIPLVRDAFPTFPLVAIGANGAGADALPKQVFELLRLLRVYSKAPGNEPDHSKPFVFRQGATLADFAARVHKDFVEKLTFARVWGHGRFEGQRIHREYRLADGDVIELHL